MRSDLAMMVGACSNGVGTEIEIGNPIRLFQSRAFQGNRGYDVATDGRFLLNVPVDERTLEFARGCRELGNEVEEVNRQEGGAGQMDEAGTDE